MLQVALSKYLILARYTFGRKMEENGASTMPALLQTVEIVSPFRLQRPSLRLATSR